MHKNDGDLGESLTFGDENHLGNSDILQVRGWLPTLHSHPIIQTDVRFDA